MCCTSAVLGGIWTEHVECVCSVEHIDEQKIRAAVAQLLQLTTALSIDEFMGIILTELIPLYTIAPAEREHFQSLVLSIAQCLARPDPQHRITASRVKFFSNLLISCKPPQQEREEYVQLRAKTYV